MAKTPSVIVGNDRTNNIAAQMRKAMNPILDADEARDKTKAETKNLNDAAETGATNARETVLRNLAAAAHAGDWTQAEIGLGAALMAKQSNAELPKSIATFIGEAKSAMHPDVREYFDSIVAIRDGAWLAEAEAKEIDKAAPQPIKKLVKRKYHLLTRMMGEGIKGNWLTTIDKVVEFCSDRDPDLNAETVYKQLEKLRVELGKMVVGFPDNDLVAAVDTLNKVQLQDLVAARAEKLGEDAPAAKPHPLANATRPNVAPASAARPTPAATVVEDGAGDVAEGASDILDDVLTNASALSQAA
jgi:hypothetical protein